MTTNCAAPISLCRIARLLIRLGCGLALLILLWSCGTVPPLHEESLESVIRVPFVRVLLAESGVDVVVAGDASFAIECLRAGGQEVFHSGRPTTIRNQRGRLAVVDYQGGIVRDSLDEVNIIPRGGDNRIHFGDKKYRGLLRLLPRGEAVRVINVTYMEDYLRGVVPPEIGQRIEEEIEAVKAQAVASRTYAMAHLGQYESEPYDIKSSIMDQLYQGVGIEDTLVSRAIDQTAGRVMMHQDALVEAYYHSTCGGRTDDIQEVWDRQEVPYLKSVGDANACSWSKYFSWREVFTEQQLRGRVEQYLASDRGRDFRIGPITDIFVGDRTAGGRVKDLVVQTSTDIYRFRKDRIRWVVGRTSNPDLILPSDNFDVEIDRDASGALTGVTFVGHGYGHGVGMCQCGAIGHSREGWTYDRILKHYYSNVEIKALY